MIAYPRHTIRLNKETLAAVVKSILRRKMFRGPEIGQFEAAFARFIGTKYAIAVGSARQGLYSALRTIQIHENSEVIMPTYTFFGLPVVLIACKLKPVFVDIDSETYNINPDLIEENITNKTKALLITHMFGQPCDMDRIMNIVDRHKLILIEDCAHSCGAEYKGRKTGSFGDFSIFSFNMGKNMPCFGGGMVATNSDVVYKKLKEEILKYPEQKETVLLKNIIKTLALFILTKRHYFSFILYPVIWFLSRINLYMVDAFFEEKIETKKIIESLNSQKKFANIQAAVGLKQLKSIEEINKKCRMNAEFLTQLLKDVKGIKLPVSLPQTMPVYLYYRVKIDNAEYFRRKLLNMGIDTKRDDMSICSMLGIFREYRRRCQIAEALVDKGIEIPNNSYLTKTDINYIAQRIKEILMYN